MLSTQEQTRQISLWDRVLMTQRYEITINKSLEECVEQVQSIAQSNKDLSGRSERRGWVKKSGEDVYKFQIYQDRRKTAGSRSAKVTGTIFWDERLEKTVLESKFTTGVISFWLFIYLVSFVTVLLSQMDIGAFLFVAAIFLAVAWIDYVVARSDYRKLRMLMEEAFRNS